MSVASDVDPLRSAVGSAIHRARKKAGISMRALADQCGVSQPFISAVERGLSTPSIATLYKLAEVLDTEPAALLPVHRDDQFSVIRAGEGRRVPASDRPDAPLGRVLLSDDVRHLEIYEYETSTADDHHHWFESRGDVIIQLLSGEMKVEFEGHPDVALGPGDWLVHPGTIPHRWVIESDEPAHLYLTIVRHRD